VNVCGNLAIKTTKGEKNEKIRKTVYRSIAHVWIGFGSWSHGICHGPRHEWWFSGWYPHERRQPGRKRFHWPSYGSWRWFRKRAPHRKWRVDGQRTPGWLRHWPHGQRRKWRQQGHWPQGRPHARQWICERELIFQPQTVRSTISNFQSDLKYRPTAIAMPGSTGPGHFNARRGDLHILLSISRTTQNAERSRKLACFLVY
jgi:hypothetical protein